MENLNENYRLSTYSDVVEIIKDKIYIVVSSLDDKIYIKKILDEDKYNIYKKLKSLSIRNIPKIYDLIRIDDQLIVIEEYINGSSLKDILSEIGTISEFNVIKYTLQLTDILDKLHSITPAIIHRDIKLSNIMLSNDGIIKLIDFDIARIHKEDQTTDTHILGTHGYASPEQFGFNQTDIRTDIYSLGVTMNKMLVGEIPVNKLYEGELSNIISKCIELDSKKRYQNMNELKDALLKEKKKYDVKKGNSDYVVIPKLPGFRSKSLILKVISWTWYMILFLGLLGALTEGNAFNDRFEDVVFVGFLFSLTLLYGNYNNIKYKLPVLRSESVLIRLSGYVLYTFLLLMITGILLPN